MGYSGHGTDNSDGKWMSSAQLAESFQKKIAIQ